MRDWFLGKVIRVADPRVLLGEQPPVPAQGARGYVIGEKLRSGSPHVKAALSRQGRYQQAAGNLQVKEVRIAGAADRFVICYNPDAAVRDATVREDLIAKPDETIAGSGKLSATKRAELRGKISMLPGLNRVPARHPRRAAPSGQDQGQGRSAAASALVRLCGSCVTMQG